MESEECRDIHAIEISNTNPLLETWDEDSEPVHVALEFLFVILSILLLFAASLVAPASEYKIEEVQRLEKLTTNMFSANIKNLTHLEQHISFELKLLKVPLSESQIHVNGSINLTLHDWFGNEQLLESNLDHDLDLISGLDETETILVYKNFLGNVTALDLTFVLSTAKTCECVVIVRFTNAIFTRFIMSARIFMFFLLLFFISLRIISRDWENKLTFGLTIVTLLYADPGMIRLPMPDVVWYGKEKVFESFAWAYMCFYILAILSESNTVCSYLSAFAIAFMVFMTLGYKSVLDIMSFSSDLMAWHSSSFEKHVDLILVALFSIPALRAIILCVMPKMPIGLRKRAGMFIVMIVAVVVARFVISNGKGANTALRDTFPFIIYLVTDAIMELYCADNESGQYELFQSAANAVDDDLQLEADPDQLQ